MESLQVGAARAFAFFMLESGSGRQECVDSGTYFLICSWKIAEETYTIACRQFPTLEGGAENC